MGSCASTLLQELKKRFGFILNENDAQYDPICLIAQALDPRYALLLEMHERTAVNNHISVLVTFPLQILAFKLL